MTAILHRPAFIFILFFIVSSCEYGVEDDISLSESARDGAAFSLSGEGGGGGRSGSGNGNGGQSEPGVITAGEWNDLDNWEFWNSLLEKDSLGIQDMWRFYTQNRYTFEIKDKNLLAVVDAQVSLFEGETLLWKARTDNAGKAELWANLYEQISQVGDKVIIEYQDQQYTITDVQIAVKNSINLPISASEKPNAVDIAFVVDATGSMADELEYLKTELLDVTSRVQAGDASLQLRTGAVFYRDEGDEYLTRVSNLDENELKTLEFIKAQSADGGGDYPEAVHAALNDAVAQLSWSVDARARLLFLILDAPPHQEPATVMEQIRKQTQSAARKGIKIIPISASGIDKPTEFLMRFMAISTNSTYVFITDDSGIGNDHLEPTVGEFEVEFLNDLMVRLVSKYTL